MPIPHLDFGNEFTAGGIDYIGLVMLQNGWWIAAAKDAPDRHVVLVKEDEGPA